MAHLSLYRKYRSQSFEELVGQDHVVKALTNGLNSGKINHAYLFTGPRGTGKTSTARLLAKCLNATGGPTSSPDPNDEISQLIAQGAHPDVIELDAASESGVEDIRTTIVEAVNYVPMMSHYKVFIIDEVHDLSAKAFDALLKTIEEPPETVVFILATTEFQKVPKTIRSRCQKFEFHRGTIADIMSRLEYVCGQEGVKAEPAALAAIARMADGGFRDSLSMLEQGLIAADGDLTLTKIQDQLGLVQEETIDEFLLAIAENRPEAILNTLEAANAAGRDPRAILESILYRLSDLSRVGYGVDGDGQVEASREALMKELTQKIGLKRMTQLRGQAAEAHKVIRDITLPRIWLESVVLNWALNEVPSSAQASTTTANKSVPAVVASTKNISEPGQRSHPTSAGIQAHPPASGSPQKSTTEPKPTAENKPVKPTQSEKESGDVKVQESAVVSSEESSADSKDKSPVEAAWAATVDAMEAQSHKVKLLGSVVVSSSGSQVTVGLKMETYVRWYNDDPRRMKYLEGEFAKKLGWAPEVTMVVHANGNKNQEEEAVELTLEGRPLYNKAKEIFLS